MIEEIEGAEYVKPLVKVTDEASGFVTTTSTDPVLFPESVEAGTVTLICVESIKIKFVPRFPPKVTLAVEIVSPAIATVGFAP